MLFYVYMQPEVIAIARDNGPYAVQALISFLRGAAQNCCLAVFEDDRMRSQYKELIESMPEDFDRKIIKSLLSSLRKRNRFLFVLTPDHDGVREDLRCVLETADSVDLDLLLLENNHEEHGQPLKAETCTLQSYQQTGFEIARSRLANEGKTLRDGEIPEIDFLNLHFDKALRHVQRIEICDRILGRQFGDNFEYTLRVLFRWLENIIADPAHCSMIFHIGSPQRATLPYIQTQLANFKRGRLERLPIELHVYDVPAPDQCLPHERFIVTDQIALVIGRGMDFLDETTHRNRDLVLGYKNMKEVQNLLDSYSAYKQPVTRF